MVPDGWNPYQASLSPAATPKTQSNVRAGPPIYGMSQLSSIIHVYVGLSMTSLTVPKAIDFIEDFM
uniref:Uncharacterized protein n=1 Tax=Daucus carota subsp. sativus TaxID=79200 RepID=A0A175YK91_DAUCS